MNEKDFMDEYNAIFERSIIFSTIARSMGLVSLENIIDKKNISKGIYLNMVCNWF